MSGKNWRWNCTAPDMDWAQRAQCPPRALWVVALAALWAARMRHRVRRPLRWASRLPGRRPPRWLITVMRRVWNAMTRIRTTAALPRNHRKWVRRIRRYFFLIVFKKNPFKIFPCLQHSESENESVRSDPHSFVNHYANVNDSLRQSWKRQKPVRNYSSYTDSEPEGSAVMSLNGGQIIMNNMARSRAPLPGFSSFVWQSAIDLGNI